MLGTEVATVKTGKNTNTHEYFFVYEKMFCTNRIFSFFSIKFDTHDKNMTKYFVKIFMGVFSCVFYFLSKLGRLQQLRPRAAHWVDDF